MVAALIEFSYHCAIASAVSQSSFILFPLLYFFNSPLYSALNLDDAEDGNVIKRG